MTYKLYLAASEHRRDRRAWQRRCCVATSVWRPANDLSSVSAVSNGGAFSIGDGQFDPFFSCTEVRSYLLDYMVPEYLPGFVPFAFDGGGGFYLFELRNGGATPELPVYYCHAGSLGFDELRIAGTSFLAACQEKGDPAGSQLAADRLAIQRG